MKWNYYDPKFEYEEVFNDLSWPWAGHKYFAYDLVRNTAPKVIVELGTHRGTSFFSFCQAIKDGNLATKAFAVDTWKGDAQAGFYGDEIINEVKLIKDKYYKNTDISLVRKTFDEAVDDFEDGTIDILHIDGLHTYDAVRHDFETWISKLKIGGIVLFHDIIVARDDFGVHELWKELKKKYHTVEFHQSYGLGVLFKGKDSHGILDRKDELEMRYAYFVEDKENKKISDNLEAIEENNREIGQKIKEIKGKNDELLKRDNELLKKDGELMKKDGELMKKDGELMKKDGELLKKEKELQEKNRRIELMESSKFWKLRDGYLRLKNLFRK